MLKSPILLIFKNNFIHLYSLIDNPRKAPYFKALFYGGFIKGRIFKIESKDYYLFDEFGNEIRCSLRGKFKKEYGFKGDKLFQLDIACIGDIVEYQTNSDGSGVINKIYERKNHLSRKVPKLRGAGTRGERLEQIIAANVDNLVVVMSWHLPEFNNRLLDRILVTGESSNINLIIVINKSDLKSPNGEYSKWTELYSKIGYRVYETSVKKSEGIEDLKSVLKENANLFWGQSGVGKSSLLNSLFPGLNLKVGDVSVATSKGKHTTVTSVMKKVDNETYVIDTPGIREIDPYGIKKEDLGHFFIEFLPIINECKFNTCTHHHEPGCAIIKAVNENKISSERYKSYLNMLETIEDDMNF